MLLRLSDGVKRWYWVGVAVHAHFRSGTRYPIQTSSFSSPRPSVASIPASSPACNVEQSFSAWIVGRYSLPDIPQVEYQDLGGLKRPEGCTPRVLRNNDVALTV